MAEGLPNTHSSVVGKILGIEITPHTLRIILRDALLALAASSILALALASLSAAGIITMGTAILELGGAFAIGVFVALIAPINNWLKFTIIFVLGGALFVLGWYEDAHFAPPITTADIKQAVEDGTREHPFHDAKQCPVGAIIFYEGGFYNNGIGVLAPPDSICFIRTQFKGNNYGVVIQP